MNEEVSQKDLVILVADKSMEFAIRGVLSRPHALGIREIEPVLHVHPERDPGCLLRSHTFLRMFATQYSHALVVLDREGSGRDAASREILEGEIEANLAANGWGQRATAIVIDPELEMWVWSDSRMLDEILGWQGKNPTLRQWLQNQGYLQAEQTKPQRPKESMELALRTVKKQRSASLYLQIAQRANLPSCTDPSFLKLLSVLREWFPVE